MPSINTATASQFYSRHEHKLIFVLMVVLSIYLLSILAKLTWSFIPSPQEQQSVTNTATTQQNISTSAQVNIQALTNLNLFGNVNEKVVEQPVEDDSDVPETRLNLVLTGVVASSDENLGTAVIEYQNVQNTYGIGDKIEGTNVTLNEIRSDRVIIKNRVTRETLMLDGVDYDEANRNNKRQQSRNQQVNSTPRNTNSAQEIRNARAELAKQPANFSDFISISQHRLDGQLIGLRVSPGAKPELFNAVGLKSGDVVMELNGLDLTDLAQYQEAIDVLNNAESLQVEVLRDDEFISLELEIPTPSGNR